MTVTQTSDRFWDENDGSVVCDYTGLSNANLGSVSWFSTTISDPIYFYNSTVDTAQGTMVGRATGALGVSKHTLTITNLTVANDNGVTFICTVEDDAATSVSGSNQLNVAGKTGTIISNDAR